MTAKSLEELQTTLEERGVKDVKFLFKRESLAVPMTDLSEDVASVLEQFLAGKNKTVVDELPGDSEPKSLDQAANLLNVKNISVFSGSNRDTTSEQFVEQLNKAISQIEAGDFDDVEFDD